MSDREANKYLRSHQRKHLPMKQLCENILWRKLLMRRRFIERERERERNIQKFNLPNTRGLLARVNSNANFMRTSRKASVRILT